MEFEDFWKIVINHGRVAAFYKLECEELWKRFSPSQQQAIYEAIERKLRAGKFVHYNPVYAIRDNIPSSPKQVVLSYEEYYAIHHTTEPVNGFQKVFLPEQQKTIYVKAE